jgi:hypothetical protein
MRQPRADLECCVTEKKYAHFKYLYRIMCAYKITYACMFLCIYIYTHKTYIYLCVPNINTFLYPRGTPLKLDLTTSNSVSTLTYLIIIIYPLHSTLQNFCSPNNVK